MPYPPLLHRRGRKWVIKAIRFLYCHTMYFWNKLYMFRRVPLSIIRSFSLYTQEWYMSNRFADSLRACSQAVSKPVWHIPFLCVQRKTPDDGQRNSPKRVEFYSKNKFEKLVHLVAFIIRIFHDARSPERQTERLVKLWFMLTVDPHLRRRNLLPSAFVSDFVVKETLKIMTGTRTYGQLHL